MNPEDYYATKWKRIFKVEILFWLCMLFFVGVGAWIVYLLFKYW